MTTVHIAIGNSDDKLTQKEWAAFTRDFEKVVRDYAKTVHGVWFSSPESMYQNMCMAVEFPHPEAANRCDHWLSILAMRYRQDSIAWNQSETFFITPMEPVTDA